MKLFVDENLPQVMARSLAALFDGVHRVDCVLDMFGRRGVKDLEWISRLGSEGGWSVLTADKRLAKNPAEKRAFIGEGLIGFVMAPALQKAKLTSQMARVLTLWDVMEQQSRIVSHGLFELPMKSTRLRPIS